MSVREHKKKSVQLKRQNSGDRKKSERQINPIFTPRWSGSDTTRNSGPIIWKIRSSKSAIPLVIVGASAKPVKNGTQRRK